MRIFPFVYLTLIYTAGGCNNYNHQEGVSAQPELRSKPATEPISANNHTIMVVDMNIDFNNQAYQHLIKASYILECDFQGISDKALFSSAMTRAREDLKAAEDDQESDLWSCRGEQCNRAEYEAVKKSYLKSYREEQRRRQTCRLVENAESSLDKVAKYPHGTLVSTILAEGLQDLSLVLVNVKFREFTPPGNGIALSTKIANLAVALHQDQEVRNAYFAIGNPVKEFLFDIAKKHNVTIVNNSWGESVSFLASMVPDDFLPKEYEEMILRLPRQRDSKWDLDSLITLDVSAAGNENRELKKNPFTGECSLPAQLNIGALGRDGKRASFSNYGECVNFFVFGEGVIVSGSQKEIDGTSFSAPLLVRYIATHFPRDATRETIVSELKKMANAEKHLPLSLMNPMFFQKKP